MIKFEKNNKEFYKCQICGENCEVMLRFESDETTTTIKLCKNHLKTLRENADEYITNSGE